MLVWISFKRKSADAKNHLNEYRNLFMTNTPIYSKNWIQLVGVSIIIIYFFFFLLKAAFDLKQCECYVDVIPCQWALLAMSSRSWHHEQSTTLLLESTTWKRHNHCLTYTQYRTGCSCCFVVDHNLDHILEGTMGCLVLAHVICCYFHFFLLAAVDGFIAIDVPILQL